MQMYFDLAVIVFILPRGGTPRFLGNYFSAIIAPHPRQLE
jgi:hypothetical protein